MKFHFLGSWIEKENNLECQFNIIENYAEKLRTGNKPFPLRMYKMDLKGTSFDYYLIDKNNSLRPYFRFCLQAIKSMFKKRHARVYNYEKTDFKTVEISQTGCINYKGKVYWSITSAILHGHKIQILEPCINHLKNDERTFETFLTLYQDGICIGSANEISIP